MDITFNKVGELWEAEFEATADFAIHLERKKEGGVFRIYQRTAGAKYVLVDEVEKVYTRNKNVVDYDCSSLIYPKFIKIVSGTEPTYCAIVSSGEVTEIKSQAKSIEITSNGTTSVEPDAGFSYLSKVDVKVDVAQSGGGGGSASASKWTGHADAEGLKAIGWTDEDIAYYQEHGVNWNAEDDEYHKVSDDNKALYGVLTADNISTYKDRIVYLPKIDTSGVTDMSKMFENCYALISIPKLDTSKVTNMNSMFYWCNSLTTIPPLDTSKVEYMLRMFDNCYSLITIPQLDTANVTDMYCMFSYCYSLITIPSLNTAKVVDMSDMFHYCNSLVSIPQLDTASVTDMSNMFNGCNALIAIPLLDASNVIGVSYMLGSCNSMVTLKIKNIKLGCDMQASALLSKESLLYIINNEVATSAITITLHSYAYTRLANDADVVAALAAHPNVSLAK